MKSQKTTKRLATLSAALIVGSVATFAADVRACSQDVAAPTVGEAVEIGANEPTDAKNDVASMKSSPKREEYRRYSTSLSNPADFDLADEHPSWTDVSEAGKRKTLVISGVYWPFRYCPPGTFAMGAAPDEPGRFGLALKTEPRRCVTLTRGFWTLEFEVTQRMWKGVMDTKNPSAFSREGEKAELVAQVDALDFPVENVSWNDCQAFVRKLNERRLAPPGFEFSLPTDAQWEYACRAGTTTPYPYGARPTKKQINYCDDISLGADARLRPLRVASLEPNPWGLYDMCGNVSEWCLDGDVKTQNGGGTGDDESPLIDPVGATVGGDRRVTRGGAYHNEISLCRSAARSLQELDRGACWRGFRVILVPVDDPETADEAKMEETADAEYATAYPTTFHIVDADGAPVPRAEVRLMKTEGEERVAVAYGVGDFEGSVSMRFKRKKVYIKGAPVGRYEAFVMKPKGPEFLAPYPGFRDIRERYDAGVVEIAPGENVATLKLDGEKVYVGSSRLDAWTRPDSILGDAELKALGAPETAEEAATEKTPGENVDASPAVERVKELGGTLERDKDGRVVALKAVSATAADVRLFVETFVDLETVVLTGRFDDETLLSLKDCRNLRSLAVRSSSSFGKTLEALASAPELRELDLSRSLLRGADLAPLAKFSKLEKLSLASVAFLDWFPDDEDIRDPAEYIAAIKTLKSLDLRMAQNVTKEAYETLATAPNLEEIYLPNWVGDEGVERLARSKSLKYVVFENCDNVTQKGVDALFAAPSIRGISFKLCRTRPNFAELPENKLERLILRDVAVDGAGLVGLEKAGASLQTLELSALGGVDAASLNQTLSRLRTLTALTLDRTPAVGDDTVETLVAALPGLESLSLRGTRITDVALDEIAKLENLRTLDLRDCRGLSQEKVAKLRDSRLWRSFNGEEITRSAGKTTEAALTAN